MKTTNDPAPKSANCFEVVALKDAPGGVPTIRFWTKPGVPMRYGPRHLVELDAAKAVELGEWLCAIGRATKP